MRSSSPIDDFVSVSLRANALPILITLINSDFDLVDEAMGRIEVKVPPGLYKIRLSVGKAEHEEFIHVQESGYQDHSLHEKIGVYTSVPDPEQPSGHFLRDVLLSAQPKRPIPVGSEYGGIALVMTALGPSEASSSESEIPIWSCEILSSDYLPLNLNHSDWHCDYQSKTGVLHLDLPAGGYVLRWFRRNPTGDEVQSPDKKNLDQSIWIEPGWRTFVFMKFDLKRNRVRKSRNIIALLRQEVGYQVDSHTMVRIALATELTLASLSSGHIQIDEGIEEILLDDKYANPMLGILACHSLSKTRGVGSRLFDVVLDNTSELIPRHPDIQALQALRTKHSSEKVESAPAVVSWPPMLYASYHSLLDEDRATQGKTIVDDSLAQSVVSTLLRQGPWTMWLTDEIQPVDRDEMIEKLIATVFSDMQTSLPETERVELERPRVKSERIVVADQRAELRVAQFLSDYKSMEASASRAGVTMPALRNAVQVSESVGLPVGSVERALLSLSERGRRFKEN